MMEKQQNNRLRAIDDLIENVKIQDFIPDDSNPAYVLKNGKPVHMPAYVPYVGPEYFEHSPRILCYAINQNLSRHRSWSDSWMQEWATNHMCAINRLNHAAELGRALPIKPYTEGFIPLAALLSIRRWIETYGGYLPITIDDVVAVTNFVKFSTSKDASSSSIPNIWWRECGSRYVSHEIHILRPDIILCFGQKTLSELRLVLKSNGLSNYEPELLGCRFPARIASIKSRPLSSRESKIWNTDIMPLISKIHKPEKSYHKWRAQNFPGYFIDVITSWDCAT